MFNAQERRKDAQINFTRGQITGQTQRAQQAYDQGTKSVMGAISGFAGAASKGVGAAIIGGADASKFADYDAASGTSKTQDAAGLKYLG